MFYKNLFHDPIKEISADQTRALVSSSDIDNYQLVDVRQPGEYEQGHIPGALLIPLGELPSRYSELDGDKETIAYCRSGVRSRSACQILSGLGIETIYNMKGGILAYNGAQVEGNIDAGLEFFLGRDFESAYELVFTMEAGLKNFYLTLADQAVNKPERELLDKLARFEDSHMKKLAARFGTASFDPESTITEGGVDIESMIEYFGDQLLSREQILQLAMKLEAQAYDLYTRLEHQESDESLTTFYQSMADEERQHMAIIAQQMDKLL